MALSLAIYAVFCFAFRHVYYRFTACLPAVWLSGLPGQVKRLQRPGKAQVKSARINGSADFAALAFNRAMLEIKNKE